MSTKVKGDKIKEGSIPLSAFSDEVKNEFKNGYKLDNKIATLTKQNNVVKNLSGINKLYICKDEIIYETYYTDKFYISSGPPVYLQFTKHSGGLVNIELVDEYNYIKDNDKIEIYKNVIQLNKLFVPNVADWNAQQGEPGYIKNRPFYAEGDIRQIDVNGEYTIEVGEFNIGDRVNVSWDLEYYDGEIHHGSASFVIQEEWNYYYNVDNLEIFGGTHVEMYAYYGSEPHYGKVTVVVNDEIKTLEEKYIPSTVLKTTPQTLSDDAKNQALANLGIDPVVWKYICNPFVIPSTIPGGYKLPSELNQIIWNNSLDCPNAIMYNLLYRENRYGIPRPLSDWDIQYTSYGDTGNASLSFDINDDYVFEIDVYGTVTEL